MIATLVTLLIAVIAFIRPRIAPSVPYDGKYDAKGNRVAPLRVAPFQ